LLESGYFRAKSAQEKLIKESGIPYTIVHATQFFEFVMSIAETGAVGNTIRMPPALIHQSQQTMSQAQWDVLPLASR
jgi:uncharacterized protein YbjT (DUF2867 family)